MRKTMLAIVSGVILLVLAASMAAGYELARGPAVCHAPTEDSVPVGPGYDYHDGAWHCG